MAPQDKADDVGKCFVGFDWPLSSELGRAPAGSCLEAKMESVDRRLADGHCLQTTFRGRPEPVAVLGRDRSSDTLRFACRNA